MKKKTLLGFLSCFMMLCQINVVHASEIEGRNLKQQSISTIENMPNLPSHYKLIDWLQRGKDLHNFIFDYTATNFEKKTEFSVKDGRDYSTIYRDDKYGGYMIPAFYGEDRPITNANGHDGEDDQESIAIVSALIAASLMGIDMDVELPEQLKGKNTIEGGYEINTYLDNALKYFWTGDKGSVFTNVPNGSQSRLQNMAHVSNAYGDFWYLLIANQNFFRLAYLNPEWRKDDILYLQETVADQMVKMVDILMETEDKFRIQCFDFEHMKPLDHSGWRQPDSAVGTANILYYAYKIFKDVKPEKAQTYLTHAMTCMDYLDGLTDNPYYENMLIDAVYLSTMMNAEQGTHYNTTKYIEWITTPTRSSVRNWGGVNYSQDGIDVYGMTGEPGNGYCYFFNSIYPMTSILPAAKYDPSYARMAGKWAINITNASRYFLPTEWSEEHQTDGEYIGRLEGNVMAYESLRKNSNGQNFYGTGDAKQNATTGWKAGANTTNFGLYGGVYTGYLGALVEETNVEGILKLDCNKTDYYQDDMYQTYLYYNPYMESKNVEIHLGNQYYDIYDSVTGMYLAKNVTGKQNIKMLADSARVIVLADPNSTVHYQDDGTTYINGKLVSHSDAQVLDNPGTELITDITIEGLDQITQRGQTTSYQAVLSPRDELMDARVIWSITDKDGSPTDKATITQDGVVTVKKNGSVIVKASSIDGSGVIGEKRVEITGQTLASLSQGKSTQTSSVNDKHDGSLAVDGDITTRWIANSGEEHPWIYVDLETQANINLIILNWEDARPPKYDIQISDDAQNWETIATVDDEGNSKKVVRFEFDEIQKGRYVRIYANEKSRHGCSLYEFDVYGNYDITQEVSSIAISSLSDKITTKNRPLQLDVTVLPTDATDKRVEWFVYNEDGSETTKAEITSTGKLIPYQNGTVKVVAKAIDGSGIVGEKIIILENQDKENLALNKTVYVKAAEGANPKEDAVDGNAETRWALGDRIDDGWITVDLGDIYDVNKVVLYWEASYASGYKIQGSLDNKQFFDLYETSQGQGGIEEVTFEAQNARYVRLQSTKRATSYGISLWEFEIYGDSVVKIPSESIIVLSGLENDTITYVKQEVQMMASVFPENTTDKSVLWNVYDIDGNETKLATISKDGKLAAKGNGQVKVVANANDGSGVMGELVITITNQDTQNIALDKDVKASSQAADDVSVKNVNDGNVKTRWASHNNNDEYIRIDLGDSYYVDQILLNWEAAYGKKYKLLGSLDDQDYFEIYNEENSDGGIDNIIFDKQLVRYVKVQGIERATNWGYSLYEFEVYGKALKENLQKLYDIYNNISSEIYTPKSWEIFNEALKYANDVLGNHNASENDVQKAQDSLQEAYEQLVERADKSELKELIDNAEDIDENQYTPNSMEALQEILEKAKEVYEDANATQQAVDATVETLKAMMDSLVEKADQSQLQKVLQTAKEINEELYTPESVKAFKEVIKEVEVNMPTDNATQEEVEEAIQKIQEAYQLLQARADNTELEKAIERAEGINREEYTKETLKTLDEAVKEAKEVLVNANATQEEVEEALKEINEAMRDLTKIESGLLRELIVKIKAMDMAKYVEESVKELEEVLKGAEEALTSSDQKKIDKMYKELEKALKGLKERPVIVEPTPEEPAVPENPVQPARPANPIVEPAQQRENVEENEGNETLPVEEETPVVEEDEKTDIEENETPQAKAETKGSTNILMIGGSGLLILVGLWLIAAKRRKEE